MYIRLPTHTLNRMARQWQQHPTRTMSESFVLSSYMVPSHTVPVPVPEWEWKIELPNLDDTYGNILIAEHIELLFYYLQWLIPFVWCLFLLFLILVWWLCKLYSPHIVYITFGNSIFHGDSNSCWTIIIKECEMSVWIERK